uniref:Uncharacterized protein n=1 Tax=Oryza brachyantha TaxID=4533 RepID=J3MB10_ORYBR
ADDDSCHPPLPTHGWACDGERWRVLHMTYSKEPTDMIDFNCSSSTGIFSLPHH